MICRALFGLYWMHSALYNVYWNALKPFPFHLALSPSSCMGVGALSRGESTPQCSPQSPLHVAMKFLSPSAGRGPLRQAGLRGPSPVSIRSL
jgi:hypothetical protein